MLNRNKPLIRTVSAKQPKLKTCSFCKQDVSKLWRSNPKTCFNCKHKATTTGKTYAEMQEQKELTAFFQDMANRLPDRCDNCGEKWGFVPPQLRHWYCAHILPKALFESIDKDPNNIIYLNPFGCNCHGNWDNRGAEDRKKMPVYQLVMERWPQLKLKLTEAEIIKAQDYLNIKTEP